MKLSRGGIIVAGVYTAFALPLIVANYFDSNFYWLASIPVAPGDFLLSFISVILVVYDLFFPPDSLMNSLYFSYAVNLAIFYFFGSMMSLIARGLDRLDERILDRLDKAER